jgi:hypothetical protein
MSNYNDDLISSDCWNFLKNYEFKLNDKFKKIEEEINNLKIDNKEFFRSTVDEVAKEIFQIEKNKNKVILKGSKGYLDILYANKIFIYNIFKKIGIIQTDIKYLLFDNGKVIIIEFYSPEIKIKALKNSDKIEGFRNNRLYLNDCLTQRQLLFGKFLRNERNSLNSQLPFYHENIGRYGIDQQTQQEFYFGIRSGGIKKIFKS